MRTTSHPPLPLARPQLFHLPMNMAAQHLGSSVSFLKKRCRTLGVARWPFRKIRSLNKLADTLEGGRRSGPTQENKVHSTY